jgi:predicted pyridoxine 5'-phosphate oxidase superfamily flavin-nucleotide-binding protein
MTVLYGTEHRALQDERDTRRLADLWQEMLIHGELAADEQAFIDARDMFFLSTVDARGNPTVSYKGGLPGFVRAIDPTTIVFPDYDGNGMCLSLGNIEQNRAVGLLFIDFETPHRLRVQGEAEVSRDPDLIAAWPGATLAVKIHVTDAFVNCARYIHRYEKVEQSRHAPAADGGQPIAEWKRIDLIQPHLSAVDQSEAEAAGALTMDEYLQKVAARQS